MTIVDFIIGLTLVNTIPHFVLGIWKGRMLSGLGIGNKANIGYAIINFCVSIGLFLYTYGVEGLLENGVYAGGLFVVIAYFLVGKICYNYFHKRFYENKEA